jgi:hypothetical protein
VLSTIIHSNIKTAFSRQTPTAQGSSRRGAGAGHALRSVSTFRSAACPDLVPIAKRLQQQLPPDRTAINDSLEYVMFAAYECPVASLGHDRV